MSNQLIDPLAPMIFPAFAVLCNSEQSHKVFALCGKVNSKLFRGHQPETITISPVIRLIGEGQYHVNCTPIQCSAFMNAMDGVTLEIIKERVPIRELADFSFIDEFPRGVPAEDLEPTTA